MRGSGLPVNYQRIAALESVENATDVTDNVGRIAELAKSDSNPAVRKKALEILAAYSVVRPEVVEAGLAGLEHQDINVRRAALDMLGKTAVHGDDRVVDVIIPLITDKDLFSSALDALGSMGHGNAKALTALIQSLNDENSILLAVRSAMDHFAPHSPATLKAGSPGIVVNGYPPH